ncbi:hypothetical protein [Paenibacillus kandeliae]|uniref:hypothetical protein n=1 Tax=Paenibacillus kandeliae TaxID=3231269 RepID=UPI00345A4DCF
MQPIHPLVYAGLGAGVIIYVIGLLLVRLVPQPRFFRFVPGLLSLLASLIILYLNLSVYAQSAAWTGLAAFTLSLIGTSLIGLVLLMFQLFYQQSKGRTSS